MSNWIEYFPFAFITVSPAIRLWSSIRLQLELKSSLINGWGRNPQRICAWIVIAIAAWLIWYLGRDVPSYRAMFVTQATIIGLIAIRLIVEAFRSLGIYKNGMLVLTSVFWGHSAQFFRWSEIESYRWGEEGRLLIGPTWNTTVCKIPAEHVVDLNAVLKEKCPNAELAIQHATQ